jgi:hypothetical protein
VVGENLGSDPSNIIERVRLGKADDLAGREGIRTGIGRCLKLLVRNLTRGRGRSGRRRLRASRIRRLEKGQISVKILMEAEMFRTKKDYALETDQEGRDDSPEDTSRLIGDCASSEGNEER